MHYSKFNNIFYNVIVESIINEELSENDINDDCDVNEIIKDIETVMTSKDFFKSLKGDEKEKILSLIKRKMFSIVKKTIKPALFGNLTKFLKDKNFEKKEVNLFIRYFSEDYFNDLVALQSLSGISFDDMLDKNPINYVKGKFNNIDSDFIEQVFNFDLGTKNGSAIGKYEIGFTLFCNDVKLANKAGDIVQTGGEKERSIEIKNTNGRIGVKTPPLASKIRDDVEEFIKKKIEEELIVPKLKTNELSLNFEKQKWLLIINSYALFKNMLINTYDFPYESIEDSKKRYTPDKFSSDILNVIFDNYPTKLGEFSLYENDDTTNEGEIKQRFARQCMTDYISDANSEEKPDSFLIINNGIARLIDINSCLNDSSALEAAIPYFRFPTFGDKQNQRNHTVLEISPKPK